MTSISSVYDDGKEKEFETTDGLDSQSEFVSESGDLSLIESLRLRQDFDSKITAKKAIMTVPARKPDKKWFVRVNGDENWQMQAALLEEGRDTYIVTPALYPEVSDVAVPSLLYTAITSTGGVFFWPIRLPKEGEASNSWGDSARKAAARAKVRWVRITPNWTFGNYDVLEAQGDFAPPVWPEMGFASLFKIAFANRIIDTRDHLVLKRLRGEIVG